MFKLQFNITRWREKATVSNLFYQVHFLLQLDSIFTNKVNIPTHYKSAVYLLFQCIVISSIHDVTLISCLWQINYRPYLSYYSSELSNISNLLGHELLKVVSYQCDILEDDLTFVHFLQQGAGLYLLQSLYVLAEQVCFICL